MGKPFYKTSEFWGTVLAIVGSNAAAASQVLDPKYAALTTGVSTAAYAIARGLAKSNPQPTPYISPTNK